MSADLLNVEGLVVDYGKIRALKGLSLRVAKGELVAVIGSNGAGKTTTLRTLSGLLRPTSGRISFEGASLVGLSPHQIVARSVAHVPDVDSALFHGSSIGGAKLPSAQAVLPVSRSMTASSVRFCASPTAVRPGMSSV